MYHTCANLYLLDSVTNIFYWLIYPLANCSTYSDSGSKELCPFRFCYILSLAGENLPCSETYIGARTLKRQSLRAWNELY